MKTELTREDAITEIIAQNLLTCKDMDEETTVATVVAILKPLGVTLDEIDSAWKALVRKFAFGSEE